MSDNKKPSLARLSLFQNLGQAHGIDRTGYHFVRGANEELQAFYNRSHHTMFSQDPTYKRNPYLYNLPRGLKGGYQHYLERLRPG